MFCLQNTIIKYDYHVENPKKKKKKNRSKSESKRNHMIIININPSMLKNFFSPFFYLFIFFFGKGNVLPHDIMILEILHIISLLSVLELQSINIHTICNAYKNKYIHTYICIRMYVLLKSYRHTSVHSHIKYFLVSHVFSNGNIYTYICTYMICMYICDMCVMLAN